MDHNAKIRYMGKAHGPGGSCDKEYVLTVDSAIKQQRYHDITNGIRGLRDKTTLDRFIERTGARFIE